MATVCGPPIKGIMMRVVKESPCGVPVTGAESPGDGLGEPVEFATDGFVQVEMSPQYEDGEEFFDRNASGVACVNEKDPAAFKRHELTIDFCSVDPSLAAYVLGARLLSTVALESGFAQGETVDNNHFSLEVWQRIAGAGACDASGEQQYVYVAWPHVGNVRVGDYTVENGRSTLQIVADTFSASSLWGNGPGAVSWLPTAAVIETGEHWVWNITTIAPPESVCGPVPAES